MNKHLTLCAFIFCATTTTAQEASLGAGFSTLGGNLEAGYRINPSFGARGIFMGGISRDYDETEDGITQEGSIQLGGLALLGDYYPTQGNWRVSGGLLVSNNEIKGSGTIDTASGTQNASASITFKNDVAPMLTTGYEWGFADRWAFTPEAGLILTGGLDIDYDAGNATAQAEIDNDPDVQKAKRDADDINVLPYLSFTVSYKF